MLAELKESYHQAEQEDVQSKNIVQQVLARSTDFLRLVISPVQRQGGITMSCVCPHCHRFLIEDFIWCAACGGQYNWLDPNQDIADASEAKVFRTHLPPKGGCLRECSCVLSSCWRT